MKGFLLLFIIISLLKSNFCLRGLNYNHEQKISQTSSKSVLFGETDSKLDVMEKFWPVNDDLNIQFLYFEGNKPKNTQKHKIPMLFIHGTFHSSWCYAENFLPFFSNLGHDCYSISLRGTSPTGLPLSTTEKVVKIEDHVRDISGVVDRIINNSKSKNKKIIVVAHSFGGLMVQKALEQEDFRKKLSSVVLMCSVPPSGNGDMTNRFIRKNFFNALKIVWGFVFLAATRSVANCRELFFDETVPESDILRYMENFKADSKVKLDLKSLLQVLPSKTSMTKEGTANWLSSKQLPNERENNSPDYLVIGAEKDFIVDIEGVEETARFLGLTSPLILPDLYHDVMLGPKWGTAAEAIAEWLQDK